MRCSLSVPLRLIDAWHAAGLEFPEAPADADGWDGLAGTIAHENYLIWHHEDYCRAGEPALIVAHKPAIDLHNQRRNDAIERLDDWLHASLRQATAAPLNSETPGSLVDRCTIACLKAAHLRELAAADGRFGARLEQATGQLQMLKRCLRELLVDAAAGRRRFMPFRQHKLYNCAATNPKMKP